MGIHTFSDNQQWSNCMPIAYYKTNKTILNSQNYVFDKKY